MVMPGYTSCPWPRDLQPQFWTKYQVWEWLQQVMDIHQIDASSVPFQNFDMDGHQLCNLSYQDFVHAAGSVGPILFHSITELKWGGTYGGGGGPGGGVRLGEREGELFASDAAESCWGWWWWWQGETPGRWTHAGALLFLSPQESEKETWRSLKE